MVVSFPSLALGTVLIVGLSGNVLLAQDQSTPPQPLPSRLWHISDSRLMFTTPSTRRRGWRQLGLTPDQQSKIEPILADRAPQIQSVRSDSTLAGEDREARLTGFARTATARLRRS